MTHGSPSPTTASERLADFAEASALSSLPPVLLERAATAIAQLLGRASIGKDDERVRAMFKVLASNEDVPDATALGVARRVAAPLAALVNAAAATAAASANERSGQIADVVAAAALAIGQRDRAAGPEVLAGVAAGLEVGARVAAALGPSHLARGWAIGGSAGRVGAAVAAARVCRLSRVEHLAAMAFAATQAGGMSPGRADLTISILVAGRASHDAVEAAVLAAEGLSGEPEPIEGRRGLLALASDDPLPDALTAGLGAQWMAVPDRSTPSSSMLLERARGLAGGSSVESLFAAG